MGSDAGTAQSLTEYDVCVGWCDVMQPYYSRWAYIAFLQAGSEYHRDSWIGTEDFKCVQELRVYCETYSHYCLL